MSVTIVSCVYGNYDDFIPRWAEAIKRLDPKPDEVIVAGDRSLPIPGVTLVVAECDWQHPQAYYLDRAIRAAATDWVWIVDIDDLPKPDGLAGLEDVDADVWQMGFDRSDGISYAPKPKSRQQILGATRNQFVGSSAFRVAAYVDCGGFADIALQDWGLWRSLARNGASFAFSGRSNFAYMRHPYTRGQTELTLDVRADHMAEMFESERLAVA